MDLSRRYRITGVPKTIVNDTVEILGGLKQGDKVVVAGTEAFENAARVSLN